MEKIKDFLILVFVGVLTGSIGYIFIEILYYSFKG